MWLWLIKLCILHFSKMSKYFFNQVFSEPKVKQTSTKPNQTLEAVVETW